jgi:hypothetical protein
MIAMGIMNKSILKVIISKVKVVPIFEPRIIPIDCLKVSIPADIRPMVITMTAELLCRRAVIMVPARSPFHGASVIPASQCLIDPADRLNSPFLISVIPPRNIAIHKINKAT